jgi:type III restriction enzyme
MDLILQRGLPHQQKAVDAVAGVFKDVALTQSGGAYSHANPVFNPLDVHLAWNVAEIQRKYLREDERAAYSKPDGFLNLDVKMETGTGKTYVYAETIFRLHKLYRFNKFVIVVPTLPIKEGTRQFLSDPYVARHFRDVCGYEAEIELGVLDPQKTKKGRRYFPGAVRDFVEGTNLAPDKIHVLLTNMHLLTNAKLLKEEYDSEAIGCYRPFDALKKTRPIVIIDEPHRFSKGQQAFQAIEKELAPPCIIRYGATFPDVTRGKGKNRATVKDYNNLLYNLDACDSFNQNLIKGIAKEHFEPPTKQEEKVKIVSIDANASVTFRLVSAGKPARSFTLGKGDSLSVISDDFGSLSITGIGRGAVEFSNGQEKTSGEEFSVDVYSTSYQEQMMRLALERHFQTERENFTRPFKIKTLALFFIDDITSYRDPPEGSGKRPYLREAFEQLLQERIARELATLGEEEMPEYRAYLKASQADPRACHAGYFAQDQSDTDDGIAREIHEILVDKKQLLAFTKPDGSFNTRRFLFSKWTLKEGWDNPNVFTITKLRSSGSDNSKIQEVGRGLRLPVDEHGNRISDTEFRLNYIVDFTEADFAEKLVAQINGERPAATSLSESMLLDVAGKLGMDADDLFDLLRQKGYIDRRYTINPSTRLAFFEEYPAFFSGVAPGKVRDNNQQKPKTINVRPAVYQELRELWEKLNEKYLIRIEDVDAREFLAMLVKRYQGEETSVFNELVVTSRRDVVRGENGNMVVVGGDGVQYVYERPLPYGEFLRRLSKQTHIAITVLHASFAQYAKECGSIQPRHFNETTLANIVSAFDAWKQKELKSRFTYAKANIARRETALTDARGNPVRVITQGLVGTNVLEGEPSVKYLYDVVAYDSPLEKENITTSGNIDEVVVYAKIPRSSIAIPTIMGGTYSPDFMYVVRRGDGVKELNVVVETKSVENKSQLREEEQAKIDCARKFFEQMKIDGYKVTFRTQINNKKMKQIIDDVLAAGA